LNLNKTIHCYKLCGYNIVLDIASGSVHSVDDVAFDAIIAYKDFDNKEELLFHLIEKHPKTSKLDVIRLFDEIDGLVSSGKLFSSDDFAHLAHCNSGCSEESLAPKKTQEKDSSVAPLAQNDRHNVPLKALCLNVSHSCNMSCAYCFADYASCENNSYALMSLETGKHAIDFLLKNSGKLNTLDVDFFGGEPLLNWDVVKGIVLYARELERKSGKKFRFTLTTNGLLIDDDVIRFTNNHMYNVVLSLDGRPEVHDAYRKLLSGDGSYSEIVPKLLKLVTARRGFGYYIRGTYTRKNMDFLNDALHIADLGFKEISLEPVVSKQGSPFELKKEDLPEIFEQYETLAVEMLRREAIGRGFSFYHFTLDLSGGPCIHKRIAGCGVGEAYLAVTPTGDLYPCHQFICDENFIMGDVLKGVANKKLQHDFSCCSVYSRSDCRDCWARFYCGGGCPANAHNAGAGISGIHELGCEIFKKRIECAIMMQVRVQGTV